MKRAAALDLLRAKAVPTESGCVLWTGRRCRDGYGRINVDDFRTQAHRLAYETARGPIPAGLDIDHLCHTNSDCPGGPACPHRACVNPAHLEAVPPKENATRMWKARKPECSSGHPFDDANTYRVPASSRSGRRSCRACNRAAVARYKAKKGSTR